MIKKCLLLVATMMVSICASAQFQEGKGYIGASLITSHRMACILVLV